MRRTFALTMLVALGTAANLFAVGEARINGKVVDAATKAPIADATILMTSVKGAGRTFKQEYKVDKDGTYAIFVLDGTIKYDIVYAAPGHQSESFNDVAKLINQQKDGEAEPLLKQAIAADDKFAPAYYELGMIYVRAGKNAEAKTNLQKYIELAPTGRDVATAKEMLSYVK